MARLRGPLLCVLLLLALALLSAAPALAKVTMEKRAPARTDVGAKTMVSVEISSDSVVSGLDVVEDIPIPLKISEWSVSGYDPSKVSYETRSFGTSTKARWSFPAGLAAADKVTIAYFFSSPSPGTFNLTTTYLYPSAFDRVVSTVKVESSNRVVLAFVGGLLALTVVLYLRERKRRGEGKLLSRLGKFGKKKSME